MFFCRQFRLLLYNQIRKSETSYVKLVTYYVKRLGLRASGRRQKTWEHWFLPTEAAAKTAAIPAGALDDFGGDSK